jgi:hypothetical protein
MRHKKPGGAGYNGALAAMERWLQWSAGCNGALAIMVVT